MTRPDESTTDGHLWGLLLKEVAREGSITEVGPGLVRVDLRREEFVAPHPVEIRMTSRQLRETVTSLSAAGQSALGIADPVAAGWGLFTIHLWEDLATLRPDERYLLWHRGALHPSVDLQWPSGRGTLVRPPGDPPHEAWEWRATAPDGWT